MEENNEVTSLGTSISCKTTADIGLRDEVIDSPNIEKLRDKIITDMIYIVANYSAEKAIKLKEYMKNYTKDMSEDNPEFYALVAVYSQLGITEPFTFESEQVVERLKQTEQYANYVSYMEKDREKILGIRTHQSKKDKEPKAMEFSGMNALAYFRSNMHAGDVVQIPLYHSGFWIAIKVPSLREIDAVILSMVKSVVTGIYTTYGSFFSNLEYYYDKELFDFVEKLITFSSIKPGTLNVPYGKVISYLDLPIIGLALLKCLYPYGMKFMRTCTGNIIEENGHVSKACDKAIEGFVDPDKLLVVNKTILQSDYISGMMAKSKPNSVSLTEVFEYQKRLKELLDAPSTYTLEIINPKGEKVPYVFHFAIPNVYTRMEAGEVWKNRVEALIEEFKTDVAPTYENERSQGLTTHMSGVFINNKITSRKLVMNSHFISHVVGPNEGEVYKDRVAIDGLLDMLIDYIPVGQEESIKQFEVELFNVPLKSQVALAAIPSYTCPSCGAKHEGLTEGQFKQYLPISVSQYFFTLGNLKITTMTS